MRDSLVLHVIRFKSKAEASIMTDDGWCMYGEERSEKEKCLGFMRKVGGMASSL